MAARRAVVPRVGLRRGGGAFGAVLDRDWVRRNGLPVGLGVSLAVHVFAVAAGFAVPVRKVADDTRLEVVLVNARTSRVPERPDVLAQSSMVGGGDHEQGRARSPFVASERQREGDPLARRQAQVAALEAMQRQLLAQAKLRASDPTSSDARAERMAAELSQRIEDYNKRPRKRTYGVNAMGVAYARYVEAWTREVERLGTERFPEPARGKFYDSLVVMVEIDRQGNVVDVRIPRRSKHEVLNLAVRDIVLAGAPYRRFPPEMAREGDVLQIVRTWNFTREGGLATAIAPAEAP